MMVAVQRAFLCPPGSAHVKDEDGQRRPGIPWARDLDDVRTAGRISPVLPAVSEIEDMGLTGAEPGREGLSRSISESGDRQDG